MRSFISSFKQTEFLTHGWFIALDFKVIFFFTNFSNLTAIDSDD